MARITFNGDESWADYISVDIDAAHRAMQEPHREPMQARTHEDMTAAELRALEGQYGCRVRPVWNLSPRLLLKASKRTL